MELILQAFTSSSSPPSQGNLSDSCFGVRSPRSESEFAKCATSAFSNEMSELLSPPPSPSSSLQFPMRSAPFLAFKSSKKNNAYTCEVTVSLPLLHLRLHTDNVMCFAQLAHDTRPSLSTSQTPSHPAKNDTNFSTLTVQIDEVICDVTASAGSSLRVVITSPEFAKTSREEINANLTEMNIFIKTNDDDDNTNRILHLGRNLVLVRSSPPQSTSLKLSLVHPSILCYLSPNSKQDHQQQSQSHCWKVGLPLIEVYLSHQSLSLLKLLID